jgi:DNA-binding response OmpR family regulator
VVLLIDDEPLVLDLLETALDDAGFAVVTASNDVEAFAAVEADGARNFAGVITDVNLRSARTGWDIARRARELCPTLPVLYVTGDSEQDWAAQGVPSSIVIPKPFAPVQVVVALATLINKPRGDL